MKAAEENALIKKHADQWSKDNGYPLQKRYFVYRKKDNESYKESVRQTKERKK